MLGHQGEMSSFRGRLLEMCPARLALRISSVSFPREAAHQPSVAGERVRLTEQTAAVDPAIDNAIPHHELFGDNGSMRPVNRSTRSNMERDVASLSSRLRHLVIQTI